MQNKHEENKKSLFNTAELPSLSFLLSDLNNPISWLILFGVVVTSSILALIGLFYDLKEIFTELFHKERILANIAILLVTAAAGYFLAPIVLPILAAAIGGGTLLAIAAIAISIVAFAIILKTSRFTCTQIDKLANGGVDSRFRDCNESLKTQSMKTREIGFFGTNKEYIELESQMREARTIGH